MSVAQLPVFRCFERQVGVLSNEYKGGFDVDVEVFENKEPDSSEKVKREILDWLRIFAMVIVVIVFIFTFVFSMQFIL